MKSFLFSLHVISRSHLDLPEVPGHGSSDYLGSLGLSVSSSSVLILSGIYSISSSITAHSVAVLIFS